MRVLIQRVSKANVLGGAFTYEGTGDRVRTNQIKVTWNDPDDSFRQTTEYVEDYQSIAETGRIVREEQLAFGCTSRGQAHRLGKWKLLSEQNEKETVSFVSGVLLTNVPFFSAFPAMDLSIGILIVSGMILIIGKYKALDRISKFLVSLLTFLTLFAVLSLLLKGSINESLNISFFEPEISPWKLSNLAFLIPLMGWMPCPVELCVWPSLWMFSRAKDSNYTPNISEAEFDFNLGYVITVVTAIFFLTLGAITMYGTGDGMLTGSGVSFAQKLILLYTKSIGNWAKWIIIPAAFAAMFSTTITCLDAYPRSISAIQGLLRGTDFGHMDSKAERNRFQIWMIVHIFASLIALLIARSGGVGVKDFVFAAMTGSFLTAPLFAWMAMDTINSKLVPIKNDSHK